MIICFKSSHSNSSCLFTEIKSLERKTPFTPSIDRIFLIRSLLVLLISVISIGPIMFDDVSKVQIEKGISYDYFGLEYEDIKPIKLTYENLESCIYSLASRNAISSDVYNTLIKFKNITLSGVLN